MTSSKIFLQRLFKAYYQEKKSELPTINSLQQREFGFIPWEKPMMIRHVGFESEEELKNFLIEKSPRHVYASGSLYNYPENQDMNQKEYKGCDFLIDIDVDHFYTPCKENHDLWYCKSCGAKGKGMVNTCKKCGSPKLSTLTWICKRCLNEAKKEVFKVINHFLVPDFGIEESRIKCAFSGHRGYHVKLEDEKLRMLSSEKRREIVDYLTGENLTLELLGLNEKGGVIYGLSKSNIGWSRKILQFIEDLLNKSPSEIKAFLTDKRKVGFSANIADAFMRNGNHLLSVIYKDETNIWNIEHMTMSRWKKFLEAVVKEISVEIDQPVSIDIHRLIRYPGSLHGKTGFKVSELSHEQLEDFDPLNENDETLDPIVFESDNLQKLKITVPKVPIITMKNETYGPYTKDAIIEVPNHVAVFFLSKEVAITI
ncbi:MAG: DNA primase small subunit domain-containing protein [Promethearchaeota archaeon]